jgi:hypothetical protein
MISVFHWWPGREFKKECPIPSFLVQEAEQRGSRYLTFISARVGDEELAGWAFCCPKDVPDKKLGRRIAYGRLMAMCKERGVEIESVL